MRARAILLAALFVVAASAAFPRAAAAQHCTTGPGSCTISGGTIVITFSRAFQLSLSSSTTALTTPTPADYNAGFAVTTGPTIQVKSNAPWMLAISSTKNSWSAANTQTEPARVNKPASDLRWSTAGNAGPFFSLGTSPVSVRNGNPTAGTAIALFYQTAYNWTLDTPGTYSLTIVLTLTAP